MKSFYKNIRLFLLGAIVLVSFACTSNEQKEPKVISKIITDTTSKSPWRKMECGLYIHQNGDIAFATNPENINKSYPKQLELSKNTFITTFSHLDLISLKSIIDTATFKPLFNTFYKDKNHIYNHFQIWGGGYFNILGDELQSFKRLSDFYVEYKNAVHHFRRGLLDVDINTFKTHDTLGQLASDKEGFIFGGDRIQESVLRYEGVPDEHIKALR